MVRSCARPHEQAIEDLSKCPREQWLAVFLPFLGPDLAAKLANDLVCRCEIPKTPSGTGFDGVDPGPLSDYGLRKVTTPEILAWFGEHYSFGSMDISGSGDVDGNNVILTIRLSGWG